MEIVQSFLTSKISVGLAVQDGAGLQYSMDSMTDRMLFLLKKTGRIKTGAMTASKQHEMPTMMKIIHRLDQDVSGKCLLNTQYPEDFKIYLGLYLTPILRDFSVASERKYDYFGAVYNVF